MRTAILAAFVTFIGGGLSASEGDIGDSPASPIKTIDRRLKAGESIKIVCLGDSVTGVYYHTGGRRAYPEMLELALGRLYPGAKVSVVYAGVSGNSTRNGLERLQRDVLDQKPDLVTVMFGLNDMVALSIEEYRINLKTIAERCRTSGASVLFCTPNAIFDDGGRTSAKLLEYRSAMEDVAAEFDIPVCDCHAAHAAVRERHAQSWRLMMSDAIHPNMDGHKLNAETIARSISGRDSSLDGIDPPQPAIPRTLKRLKEGEPLRVLAMTPVDQIVEKSLRVFAPAARIELMKWETEGKTLQQLEAEAKQVRGKSVDLVVLAIPVEITPRDEPAERDLASFIWIMNWSLSFGRQEWDVVVLAPSVLNSDLGQGRQQAEVLTRRLVRAQDLSLLVRDNEERLNAEEIVVEWLRNQQIAPR